MSDDFFTRLNRETEPARNELLTIPFITQGASGQLSLESYIAFLTQAYHHVKHTTPLLMACGARIPSEKEWLRDAMAHYIEEELGHQEWILKDLSNCGADAEAIRHGQPSETTDIMVSYAYDLINRKNPVGFLGMVLVLEGTSIKLATQAADNIQKSLDLPDNAFSYLRSHGELDKSHIHFYAELVNKLPAEDQAYITTSANIFYRLYGNIFKALPLHLRS